MADLRKFYVQVESCWQHVMLNEVRKGQIFRVDGRSVEYLAVGEPYVNDTGIWTIHCEELAME